MKKTTSGIRGIFGKDFDLKDTLHYCNNFSSLIDSKKCIVGRDTRDSGQMILDIAKSALMQNGIDVYDLGIAPTPVIFREARKYGAGIVVTASHNPTDWNGLKFIIKGRGINESQLGTVLENIDMPESNIGTEEGASTAYVEQARGIIGNISNNPDVVVDLGGGAARGFVPSLLEQIGCRVKTINNSIHKCSRLPDPTADDLRELVAETGHDKMGFAFDLDGDRLVIVKDKKVQPPDATLGLGIAKSINLGYKSFVLSVDSSIAIEKFIDERGGTIHRSKVGEANVMDMILETGAHAGGEGSSGGFIMPEFNYCRDGILASGLVASMTDDPEFGKILDHIGRYCQIRKKIPIPAKNHDIIIEKILEESSGQFSDIITIDGMKGIIDEDSWIMVRKSNTEDVIRISAESDMQDKCKNNIKDMTGLVNRHNEQIG